MQLTLSPLNAPFLTVNHDHNGCRDKALKSAERICDNRGVRLTPIRRQVLELIWESHRAIKAYDLLDRIKPKAGTAKPATVYRALDFLMEQGLIHKVESLNAFIGCSYSEHQHQQLLLTCTQCQEVEERPADEVMEAIAKELERAAFIIHHKAIEIHGICGRCTSIQ
ncbi:transcriptional repressor [Methylomonas sp. AM2-LC]|uniref:transcriptional repressor n=1 Tax=Methylomonas sp. AM2-LC TaxID=3153301 RepID=UPI0032656F03